MKKISGTLSLRLVICLLAVVLLSVSAAWAKPTTPEQAGNVVMNWLSLDAAPLGARLGAQIKEGQTFNQDADNWTGSDTAPPAAPSGPQIKEVQTYYHQGTPVYYVVYLNPAGLVFLPADDLVEPIIGFLPEGQYDPSPANPLGALVSRDLPGRVLQARADEAKGLEALAPEAPQAVAQRKWAWLANPGTNKEAAEFGIPSVSDVRVAPLVQSKWDQSLVGSTACYNYYTPMGSAGSASNYVCGCVATAMAQLMRFWNYPDTGVGTGTYTITYWNGSSTVSSNRTLRGGNGAGSVYDWANMILDPATSGVNTTQRQAIGALTYDAGLSVNMDYNPSSMGGSGTDTCAASAAFVNTFHYSNAKNAYSGSSSTSIPATNRNNMVNANLDAGYPTLLGIRGSAGGHAIVCDGYGYNASTLYNHLNMGWSGSDNAWYALPIIDTSWTTFDVQYKVIYNVYKTGTGEIISGRVTSGGAPLSGVTVTATGTGGPYTATTNAQGIYALPKVHSATTYTVSPSKTGYTFSSQSVTTATSTDWSTTTGNKWGINFVAGSTPPAPSGKVLYNNGPLVNSPGTGAGGADESALQGNLGMTLLGTGNQVSAGNRIADDFKLNSRSHLQKIKFYAYQTGSTTTSTITAVNLRIWTGPPNNPGSTVIYGDTTTNRMSNTTWANVYRVTDTTHGDTQRPVMLCTATVDVNLNPGTYWLDWQVDGTLASGPWAPPITINGQTTTGNALQFTTSSGSWGAALDAGTNTQQGFPFIIEGTGGANVSPLIMLLSD